jgi:hypothetical protein
VAKRRRPCGSTGSVTSWREPLRYAAGPSHAMAPCRRILLPAGGRHAAAAGGGGRPARSTRPGSRMRRRSSVVPPLRRAGNSDSGLQCPLTVMKLEGVHCADPEQARRGPTRARRRGTDRPTVPRGVEARRRTVTVPPRGSA